MQDSQEIQISGKMAIMLGVLVIVGVVIRLLTFSDSADIELEKDVRAQLWSTYCGQIGTEITKIRTEGDYGSVPSLLEKANPEAIIIEQINRSEPLLSWASTQDVIVSVRYRFPDDTETQTEYMRFNHSAIAGWVYQYDSTALAYYMNLF